MLLSSDEATRCPAPTPLPLRGTPVGARWLPRSLAVVLVGATLAPVHPAIAQAPGQDSVARAPEDTADARRSGPLAWRAKLGGRFLVGGGGLLVPATDGARESRGLALQFGYERQIGRSPFGVRLEGTQWKATMQHPDEVDGAAVTAVETRDAYGANLLGTLRLGTWGVAPGVRLRPYVLAGGGLQQTSRRMEATLPPSPGGRGSRGYVFFPSQRGTHPAVVAGLGLDVGLGRASLLLEARSISILGNTAYGGGGITPVTVGFRF